MSAFCDKEAAELTDSCPQFLRLLSSFHPCITLAWRLRQVDGLLRNLSSWPLRALKLLQNSACFLSPFSVAPFESEKNLNVPHLFDIPQRPSTPDLIDRRRCVVGA